MRQLFAILILFIGINAFGQIRTTEVEIRSATSSELNEIEGETTVKGRVNIRNSSAGGGVSGNYDNLVIEEDGTHIGLSFKSSNAHNAGIAFGDSDDQNSGRILYSHSNNHMSFYVNDAERVRIRDNGWVGIGTTNPQGKLHIRNSLVTGGVVSDNFDNIVIEEYTGNNGITFMTRNNQNSGIAFADSDGENSGVINYLHGSDDMFFSANGEEMIRIKGNGFVGIGTSSPSGRLEVSHSGNSELVVSGGGTSHANAGIVLKATNGTNQRATGIFMHDELGANEWFAGRPYSGSDKYVILRNPNAQLHNSANAAISTTDVEALFTLKSGGDLGLNNSNPDAKLHVRTGDAVNYTWSRKTGTSAIFESSELDRNFLTIVSPNQSEINFADVEDQNPGRIRYLHGADKMELWTADGRKMTIDASGNMGIGTWTPSEKLHVNGNVLANNVSVSSDFRWKKDISPIKGATVTLNSINAVSYKLKKDEFPERDFDSELHYGVIAQELEKVLPELVSTDNEGYKSVDYLGMIGLLIKGYQERGEEIQG